MSVKIGEWTFDHFIYDEEADVLYLSMGPPRAGYGEETAEGHFLRFDENGEFYGVALVDAQRLLNDRGNIEVTIPRREYLERPNVAEAFA